MSGGSLRGEQGDLHDGAGEEEDGHGGHDGLSDTDSPTGFHFVPLQQDGCSQEGLHQKVSGAQQDEP